VGRTVKPASAASESTPNPPDGEKPRARTRKKSGNGEGWGGPARGAGNGSERKDLGGKPGPGRGNYSKAGEGRLERQARHAEEMRKLYYEFATDGDKEDMVRLKAATHLLDRSEGLPIQRTITASTDPVSLMTDDELEAERTKLERRKKAFDRVKKRAAKPDK
jgi:hypothetical protein